MKNAKYNTLDETVQKIVFDFYRDANGNKTTEEVYYVDGDNVISGLTGVDATSDASGKAKIYGAGTKTVYVLSSGKMYLPSDASDCFEYFCAVSNILFINLDTSNTTNMQAMFYCVGCKANSVYLDLSCFDTSNVTDMRWMFDKVGRNSTNDIVLNLISFNTKNVTSMEGMFALTGNYNNANTGFSLDLSSFDTSNVTNMFEMFSLSYVGTIYVSDLWTTEAVEDSGEMFSECDYLVGGNGTKYSYTYTDATYARIDKSGQKGYFTYKAAPAESASEGRGNENVVIAFGSGAVAIFGAVAFVWFYRKKKFGRFVGRMNK